MRTRTSRLFGTCAIAAALAATAASGEQLNVSKIATGTHRAIDWSAVNALPEANDGATLSYFTLATTSIDTEATPYFAIAPWSAAYQSAPTHPKLERSEPADPYMIGNATFTYSPPISRVATADMKASPKSVASRTGAKGRAKASATVSYAARIEHTGSAPLDYFVELKVPSYQRDATPAYDLSSSSDSGGGTYTYHVPDSAKSRGAVDVYVDGLPVWSNESVYHFPDDPNNDPFAEQEWSWGNPAGPATSTLYLGRLSSGKSLTVTLIARTNVNAKADYCGIQGPFSPFGDPEFSVHCLQVSQSIELKRGGDGEPVGFRIYSKHPLQSVSGGSPQ
jgi:hypothetical protein